MTDRHSRWLTGDAKRAARPRPDLVTAQVRIPIHCTPEAAFDYFADLRNEPEYNSQVAHITKSSAGPVGEDTTFTGMHVGLGPVTWRLSEYRRPEHVVVQGTVGHGVYRWTGDFEHADGGTVMIGRMEWQPPAPWPAFGPLLARILSWNARRSFRRMAEVLERSEPRKNW